MRDRRSWGCEAVVGATLCRNAQRVDTRAAKKHEKMRGIRQWRRRAAAGARLNKPGRGHMPRLADNETKWERADRVSTFTMTMPYARDTPPEGANDGLLVYARGRHRDREAAYSMQGTRRYTDKFHSFLRTENRLGAGRLNKLHDSGQGDDGYACNDAARKILRLGTTSG